MSPTWEHDQIQKLLRKRSERLAKGATIEDLPHELTIEGIASHYQKSTTEIEDLILRHEPARHG